MDYQAFLQTGIDLGPLGLEKGGAASPYDCTPLGAEVLFRTGVDGVHYCTIPEYGGTVFAVEPMGLPGEAVRPVAEDFAVFLRLLLDHTEAAIQQMGRWSRKQYENFQRGEWPDAEQQAVRDAVAALGLAPVEDAYAYIKTLQEGFDPAALRFSREYLDSLPQKAEARRKKWKVTFGGGFSDQSGTAGECLPVNGRFLWNGRRGCVPAVYLCEEGLVADLALSAPPEVLPAAEEGSRSPLNLEAGFTACVNGETLRESCGHGCQWLPPEVRGDWEEPEGRHAAEHYGLDKTLAWGFWRVSFPWSEQGRPERVQRLTLTLDPGLVRRSGPVFAAPGTDAVTFTHPATGQEHTLRILAAEPGVMDPARFRDQTLEYPTHYTVLEYEVTPEAPRGALTLRDTGAGDAPRRKAQPRPDPLAARFHLQPAAVHSVGLVLGVSAGSRTPGRQAAASNLYFTPREQTSWQLVFHVREQEAVTVELV